MNYDQLSQITHDHDLIEVDYMIHYFIKLTMIRESMNSRSYFFKFPRDIIEYIYKIIFINYLKTRWGAFNIKKEVEIIVKKERENELQNSVEDITQYIYEMFYDNYLNNPFHIVSILSIEYIPKILLEYDFKFVKNEI
jgi:hypothetical protein